MNDYVSIQCGHRHKSAPLDLFVTGPKTYHCPNCHFAWEMVETEPARIIPERTLKGQVLPAIVIPPTMKMQPILL